MIRKTAIFGWLVIFWLFTGCSNQSERSAEATTRTIGLEVEFARGFKLSEYQGFPVAEILRPYPGASESIKYLLLDKNSDIRIPEEFKVIHVPVNRIACVSTTHVALLDLLDVEDRLVAFPGLDYIYSPAVRSLIEQGNIRDIGPEISLNIEVLMTVQPDLLMGYSMTGDLGEYNRIETAGIPVVLNAEYLEETPLGRAEWIKFMGVLVGKSALADSIFNGITDNYEKLKLSVDSIADRPTVFSGIVYNGTWFMPGGRSWAARYFSDAGADFLWSETPERGSLTLSFETVYKKAVNAEYWVNVSSMGSLDEIGSMDPRYTDFLAFKNGNVYNYNARTDPRGGNDYFEQGNVRPDRVLKDLVYIFHPGLLPDHELYFYKKLQ